MKKAQSAECPIAVCDLGAHRLPLCYKCTKTERHRLRRAQFAGARGIGGPTARLNASPFGYDKTPARNHVAAYYGPV
jgi:hypothetical protein